MWAKGHLCRLQGLTDGREALTPIPSLDTDGRVLCLLCSKRGGAHGASSDFNVAGVRGKGDNTEQ